MKFLLLTKYADNEGIAPSTNGIRPRSLRTWIT